MARKTETATPAPPPASEEQVVAYMRAHPDFLARHPELLTRLEPPARFGGDGVVDFQHYMIQRLHDELDEMRGCAEHLISTSRSNMSTQNRTHETALTVLGAGSMAGLARAVAEDLPTLLDVDVATIGFETGSEPVRLIPGLRSLHPGFLEEVMGQGDVMLRGAAPGDQVIFGDAAGLVGSYALVRLAPGSFPPGLLALGSRNERTFHSSQGTDLLAFLARIIEDCVARWWPQA